MNEVKETPTSQVDEQTQNALDALKCKCGSTEVVKLVDGRYKCLKCGYRYRLSYAPIVKAKLPGRNDPCICGSGIKFKKCHGI